MREHEVSLGDNVSDTVPEEKLSKQFYARMPSSQRCALAASTSAVRNLGFIKLPGRAEPFFVVWQAAPREKSSVCMNCGQQQRRDNKFGTLLVASWEETREVFT